jgi:hypothetical protein
VKSIDGLQQQKEFKDITFLLKYRPVDEMILSEIGEGKVGDSLYKKLYDKYKDLRYFTFAFKSDKVNEIMEHNGSDDNEYFKLLDYLTNGIQNDFTLVDGKDTLQCVLCHYERNYGLSGLNNLSLAFTCKNEIASNDLVLGYDDKLFKVGKLNFRISKELLNEIPSLAYEK